MAEADRKDKPNTKRSAVRASALQASLFDS